MDKSEVEKVISSITEQILDSEGAAGARVPVPASVDADIVCAELRNLGYEAWSNCEVVGFYADMVWGVYAALPGRSEAADAIGRFAHSMRPRESQ